MQVLERKWNAYNAGAKEELKEMNQNKITNIIDRGGIDDWETAPDLSSLKRAFAFTSFEQAQYFIQHVGIYCSEKDHHPEWEVLEGGKVVSTKLTSHFAGNKVTLFDFELAEQMNDQYKITKSKFRMYPFLSSHQWSSVMISGIGSILGLLIFGFSKHWYDKYKSPHTTIGGLPRIFEDKTPVLKGVFHVNAAHLTSERELESYAAAYVDEYAFAHVTLGKPLF